MNYIFKCRGCKHTISQRTKECPSCGDPVLFLGHYVDWRTKRIAKLISIFGKEFFNGKDVLELGCGFGDIGEQFVKLGSNVMFCDGRQEFLLNVKKRMPGCLTRVIDQNNYWDLGKSFGRWGSLWRQENE